MNEVCFQKRKRGRPRKLYDCINDYHHENEVQNDTLQGKIVCSTIFKRRLRRRSSKIATCSDTFVGKTTNDNTCMVKLPLDTNGTIGNKINPVNKDNLINKIGSNQSLQKNKRRQSKIILPSDEFHNENEQELHVSSVDNSIVSTPEKYSENKEEDLQN
ncbi:PREDICTED: uncharacterized protein LOC105364082 [Ceratosolen solmsi marchali]|uniref:Uncharacterized protein LOC105364082 n=1 Tax=Ceratosolen solmsi marchali TaxID=326594 RepID=A0AAJ6YLH3_9HYME|nr:PREDICTED: uncharacterized protein LOC105364082 [Ceratosolen solmsi marchali]